jgi:DNA invertase Pin-like site-specific DNA recombinase
MVRKTPPPRKVRTKGRLLGYARVSSKKQEANSSFEVQELYLKNVGVSRTNITRETGSSKENKLPFKHALLESTRSGDTLFVLSADRFGRCFLACEQELTLLITKGVTVYFGNQRVTTEKPIEILIRRLLLIFAEFSNSDRSERTKSGIRNKKKQLGGWKGGRPSLSMKVGLEKQALDLFNAKTASGGFLFSKTKISKHLGISLSSVYRMYNQYLAAKLIESRKKPKK